MSTAPAVHPPALLVEPVVRRALEEDLGGAGDLTTDATVPAGTRATVRMVSRKPGRVAGLEIAATAFRLVEPSLAVRIVRADGTDVEPGDTVMEISGPARGILTGERVALNFATHLSGVATATRAAVEQTAGTRASIVCTRKTLPGLRLFQKYAIRVGGGANHRYGLDDAVLVKDNHIAVAGGIRQAAAAVRAHAGHMVKVEIEVDSLDQLSELLTIEPLVDAVLLDNIGPEKLAEAVKMVGGRMLTEASGGIRPETVGNIAKAGVDLISLGWLTHSVTALDLGLDFDSLG